MKIARLLECHDRDKSEYSLDQNWGDSFLVKNNKIYRNIRKECIKQGFKFSHDLNADYLALPLSQLDKILSAKIIPYHNNVSVLKQIEKQVPNSIQWSEVSENLKKNYIFHESCHAVARTLSQDFKFEKNALKLLLEESFANTCELFSILEAEDQVHRIFFDWNSYSALYEVRTNFTKAVKDIGEELLFKVLFFGYLHANFLFNNYEEKDFKCVLGFLENESGLKLSSEQIKTIRALIKICFTLDMNFRLITTRLYMRLNDIIMDNKLTNFSYFDLFRNNPGYGIYLDKMVQLALNPV